MTKKGKEKGVAFKAGDKVTVCPDAMRCPVKSGKLMGRTKLKADELNNVTMTVESVVEDGQLVINHPSIVRKLLAHHKYFVPHQAQQQTAA